MVLLYAPGLLSCVLSCAALTSLSAQDPVIPADTEMHTTASGLEYSILVKGDGGAHPSGTDKVKVEYSGWLADGTLFDSSRGRGAPSEFSLNVLIDGWSEGLQLMTKGARYKFTIPYQLAYGEDGKPPTIPAKAKLIFDVELLGFSPVPKAPVPPTFPKADPKAQSKTKSGLIYEVLQEGKGQRPAADDNFEVEYAMFRPDGTLLDGSFRSNMMLGKRHAAQLGFIGEAVGMMRVGTLMRVEVPVQQCFPRGLPQQLQDLGEEARMVWTFELKRVIKPLPVPDFSMPAEDQLTTTPSGLKYRVLEEGSGQKPTASQKVTVNYAGWLTDGTLFDSSYPRGETASFRLQGVIKGWTEGLQLMKPGAIYQFVIPGDLAYGTRGSPPKIGPNATLVFRIELIKIGS